MKLAAQIETWTAKVDRFLADRTMTRNDVTTGVLAWDVAHRTGLCNQAYALSRDVTDGHIQTALQRIFPNAVFRDAKSY